MKCYLKSSALLAILLGFQSATSYPIDYQLYENTDANKSPVVETIESCNELTQKINANPVGRFELTKDIDCRVYENFEPMKVFHGTLNGNHHTISNVFINGYEGYYPGLFSGIYDNAVIKNLTLDNVNITAYAKSTGALAGWARNATFDNIKVTRSKITNLSSSSDTYLQAGGLIGYIEGRDDEGKVLITNIHINAEVSGHEAGGIAGRILCMGGPYEDPTCIISDSASHGEISTIPHNVANYGGATGGLVGFYSGYWSENVHLHNSYSEANVTADENGGGLIGYFSSAHIHNSYAKGRVTGNNAIGGLLGFATDDGANEISIINSYATGEVSATQMAGGLVGSGEILIDESFWDIETTGQRTSSGDGAEGKSTAEMKQKKTFTDAGWDFGETWDICGDVNHGYPYLQRVSEK